MAKNPKGWYDITVPIKQGMRAHKGQFIGLCKRVTAFLI